MLLRQIIPKTRSIASSATSIRTVATNATPSVSTLEQTYTTPITNTINPIQNGTYQPYADLNKMNEQQFKPSTDSSSASQSINIDSSNEVPIHRSTDPSSSSSSSSHSYRPYTPRNSYHPRSSSHETIDSMIRVDHAGEFGAKVILEGQLAVLGKSRVAPVIESMKAQEIGHLRALEAIMPQRRVRPTIFLPIWSVAGYALGVGTALMGEKAAMACTVAVEEVIAEHYNDQLRTINEELKDDQELKHMIRKHRDDEEEHRDIGLAHDAVAAPFYSVMSAAIKTGCKAAIWLSSRI